ncbi:hypothetical protein VKT23_009236 [Stygiomarasmius scandens]|uniref:Hydrophobin n=1 Tax=Marasmiellus scandens TaxID=2682957 RepID=A0ABR1JK19_9AGAR
MFARSSQFIVFLLFGLPLLAAASAIPAQSLEARQDGQCSTGTLQCCQSVQSATSPVVSLLLGLLGVVLGDLNLDVGLTCSPISVIGVGGNSCTAQPVCCQNNNFNGLIAIGCSPISISL